MSHADENDMCRVGTVLPARHICLGATELFLIEKIIHYEAVLLFVLIAQILWMYKILFNMYKVNICNN